MRKIITVIAIFASLTSCAHDTSKKVVSPDPTDGYIWAYQGGDDDTLNPQFAGIGHWDINPFYPDSIKATQVTADGYIVRDRDGKFSVVGYDEMKRRRDSIPKDDAAVFQNKYQSQHAVVVYKDTLEITDTTIKQIKFGHKRVDVKDLGKVDTIHVAVYIFDKTDTVQVGSLYGLKGKKVQEFKGAYRVVTYKVATTDGKTFQPMTQPVSVGALDNKKKPFKAITQ